MKAVFETAYPYQKDKLNLPVENLEKALPFYESVLGFQILSRQDSPCNSAILERDGIQIGLAENGGDPEQDGCFFEVSDAEAAFEEFRSNGLNVEKANYKMQQYGAVSYKVFYVVAPDKLCYSFGERQN